MDNQKILDAEQIPLQKINKPLYSTTAMYVFSFLFTPLALAFMLYANLRRIDQKQNAITAAMLCIGLIVGQFIISSIIPFKPLLLMGTFWCIDKIIEAYIDDDYVIKAAGHDKRNLWGLLAICLSLSAAIFYAIINGY